MTVIAGTMEEVQQTSKAAEGANPGPSAADGEGLPTLLAVDAADVSPKMRLGEATPLPGKELSDELDDRKSRIEKEKSVHIEDFKARTGMSPKMCYRLVLASLSLRLLGGGWIAMVAMEYARYYVINDLSLLNVLQTCTNSPQMAIQAFLFPLWGVVADRLSRKKVLVAATLAQCTSACLMTFIPSVEVYIFTRVLNLVSDIGGPIRDAMLRDLFCDVEWESEGGGVTGIKSRMALIGGIASAASMMVGMALLAGGRFEGSGFLPNEYQLHKDECKGHVHCVKAGQYSWGGKWHVDGCLRQMMLMGSIVLILDALLVIFFLPETIRPEHKRKGSLRSLIRSSWEQVKYPWNNLRVIATPQLRTLLGIREIGYIVVAGGSSAFISFYGRYDFDTLTMYCFSASAMIAGWFTLMAVPHLVSRYGDLKGIWIPGTLGALLFAISSAFLIGDVGFALTFAIFPLFAGPSFALQGLAPELIAKQIPSDLQATFQTGKSFLFRLTQAVFLWPWMGLQVASAKYPYPWDALPLLGTTALGLVALFLTVRQHLRHDPKDAIENGDALADFWKSDYARSGWYRLHAAAASAEGPEEAAGGDEAAPPAHVTTNSTFLPSAGASNMSLPTFAGLEDGLGMARTRKRAGSSLSQSSTGREAAHPGEEGARQRAAEVREVSV